MWISDYLAALSLTMVIEVAVAALWGYRSYFAIRTVILANLMSHPLLTYLLWVNQYFRILDFRASVAILEILVVFLEWGCFVFVLRVNLENCSCSRLQRILRHL